MTKYVLEDLEIESREAWMLKRKHVLNMAIKKAQDIIKTCNEEDKIGLNSHVALWKREFKKIVAETKTEKTCTKCNETYPVEFFHKYAHNADGRHSHCKYCKGKYQSIHEKEKRLQAKKMKEKL